VVVVLVEVEVVVVVLVEVEVEVLMSIGQHGYTVMIEEVMVLMIEEVMVLILEEVMVLLSEMVEGQLLETVAPLLLEEVVSLRRRSFSVQLQPWLRHCGHAWSEAFALLNYTSYRLQPLRKLACVRTRSESRMYTRKSGTRGRPHIRVTADNKWLIGSPRHLYTEC
jgi:hypothetical protein